MKKIEKEIKQLSSGYNSQGIGIYIQASLTPMSLILATLLVS